MHDALLPMDATAGQRLKDLLLHLLLPAITLSLATIGATARYQRAAMIDALDLGSLDVGNLLEGFGEQGPEGDAEKWARVIDKILSIEYGLRSQQTEALARMDVALGANETNQVLGLLDAAQQTR